MVRTPLNDEWLTAQGFRQGVRPGELGAWRLDGRPGFKLQLIAHPLDANGWILELGNIDEEGRETWTAFPATVRSVQELWPVVVLMDVIPF